MTTHGPGKNKVRINLAVHEDDAQKIKNLADSSGLSVNSYINAILADAIDSAALVKNKITIVREPRGSYSTQTEASDQEQGTNNARGKTQFRRSEIGSYSINAGNT